ncbi:sporulation protein [Xenophilus arseniciresistens]|uniref:Sporulation protein n=1 Tax=Xenophilus arseniciresistens TaxID=1283306 RepID=A0AAE3T0T8_9BURK|nr:sporulation protein [Xenophilus arseniciresistens]MDA7418562.1 sporulation protein [Xenophilus arseniciresistens]
MMLRAVFAVLVLANLGYFLWSRADASARQAAEREPQRLSQQIQPQWLQVLPAGPAR